MASHARSPCQNSALLVTAMRGQTSMTATSTKPASLISASEMALSARSPTGGRGGLRRRLVRLQAQGSPVPIKGDCAGGSPARDQPLPAGDQHAAELGEILCRDRGRTSGRTSRSPKSKLRRLGMARPARLPSMISTFAELGGGDVAAKLVEHRAREIRPVTWRTSRRQQERRPGHKRRPSPLFLVVVQHRQTGSRERLVRGDLLVVCGDEIPGARPSDRRGFRCSLPVG